jgi:hypothetical protein
VDPGNVTRGISCQTYPQTTQTVTLKTIRYRSEEATHV